MAFPYWETCQQLFHPLLKGQVASAHLPVSALHIPPQDATAAWPFLLQGKHTNSKGAAYRDAVGCSFAVCVLSLLCFSGRNRDLLQGEQFADRGTTGELGVNTDLAAFA